MPREFWKNLPGMRSLSGAVRQRFRRDGGNVFLRKFPPGHFYSPIPDGEFVQQHRDRLFDREVAEVPGIDTRADGQLALLTEFARFYPELPFPAQKSGDRRYYFENSSFCWGDAMGLYSMLRHLRPQRVIEVGSGFSSAVMLDTNDLCLNRRVKFTFIEPYPERLFSLLNDADRQQHEILVSPVQDVPLQTFQELQAGDILFIDSSHVGKIGSDVLFLLTSVLPALARGVYIHVHDVFWPFEYPEEWVRGGRAWNEDYLLRAFLQFNTSFRIEFFNQYLATHHRDALERSLPLFARNPGGSFWMSRVA